VIHKRTSFICFALRHMFIFSANIRPVVLPPANIGTLVGVTAVVSGWGRTSQSKCVDPFSSYSTDKE